MPSDPAATVKAIQAWDVIYPFDNRVHPSKHKMWVCVSRINLWFLRINSLSYGGACVPLEAWRHPFLERDSHIGCGGDLISVGEAELEDLVKRQLDPEKQGIVGQIHSGVRPAICAALGASPMLSPAQIRHIKAELGCA